MSRRRDREGIPKGYLARQLRLAELFFQAPKSLEWKSLPNDSWEAFCRPERLRVDNESEGYVHACRRDADIPALTFCKYEKLR